MKEIHAQKISETQGEKSKDCKETNDTPDQVETYFVQGLVHFTPFCEI